MIIKTRIHYWACDCGRQSEATWEDIRKAHRYASLHTRRCEKGISATRVGTLTYRHDAETTI